MDLISSTPPWRRRRPAPVSPFFPGATPPSLWVYPNNWTSPLSSIRSLYCLYPLNRSGGGDGSDFFALQCSTIYEVVATSILYSCFFLPDPPCGKEGKRKKTVIVIQTSDETGGRREGGGRGKKVQKREEEISPRRKWKILNREGKWSKAYVINAKSFDVW